MVPVGRESFRNSLGLGQQAKRWLVFSSFWRKSGHLVADLSPSALCLEIEVLLCLSGRWQCPAMSPASGMSTESQNYRMVRFGKHLKII